jgi:hypothetical protein
MNENMVRLLVQSGVPNEDIMDILTTGEGKITSYALEVFAKSIVEKCGEFCTDADCSEMRSYGEYFVSKINRHFGVK